MAGISIRNSSLFGSANLVAYYETSAGALTTDSKASYTLTNTNTVADGTGNFSGGADFSASNTNKSLSIANNLGIAGTADIGISFWVKMLTEINIAGDLELFAIHTSTTTADRYFQMYYHATGGNRILKLDAAGNVISSNQTLGTTNWHHIVINRISGATEMFYDGASIGTSTAGTATMGTDTFVLGNQISGGTSFPADVVMDDIAVFSRGLTSAEVSGIYNGTLLPSGGFMMYY